MNFNTLAFKLIAFIVAVFTLMIAGVFILADHQLKKILLKSSESQYAERLDTIHGILSRNNERLEKTGLVNAYIDDFQQSALEFIQANYYKQPDQAIFPFILDADGRVILHPVLEGGDMSIWEKRKALPEKIRAGPKDSYFTFQADQNWFIFKKFEAWNWEIGYIVPFSILYQDAHNFSQTLLIIMVSATACVLLLSGLAIAGFTKPIVKLTAVAKRITGGDLDQAIDISGRDEVGILARSFDNMRSAIKKQIEELKYEIRERRQAEERVSKLRNYLTNVIDSMPSVLIGVDMEKRVTQWNKQAEKMTGVPFEQAVTMSLDTAFPKLAEKLPPIETAIKERRVISRPKFARQEAGETRYEDITIYPLVANGVEGVVIRLDDVTERVRFEEMLIQNEKMLSVGGLAAGMAHEINNPLAGIIQNIQVLNGRLTDKHMPANTKAADALGLSMDDISAFIEKRGMHRMIEAITRSSQRISETVNNMLSFARKSDSTYSSHHPAELLDQVLALAATDYDLKKHYDFKSILIEKIYADNLPMIPCDGSTIQQVLLNILNNGAHAMFENKNSVDPKFILRLYVEKDTSMLRMEIQDNGPGMDKQLKNKIFEPFYTTKPVGVGTGLGLSISYFIITEHHGGTIKVESEPGKGANFVIRLPLTR